MDDKHQSMQSDQDQETIQLLRHKLLKHQHCYHTLDRPIISDAEYDDMLRRLEDLEIASSLSSPNTPTQNVGADILPAFSKFEHKTPMLSLANAFDLDDLKYFERSLLNMEHFAKFRNNERIEYCVELKIDGVAITLIYAKGILVQAATRGNGKIGENVTANARTINDIPSHIPLSVLKDIARDKACSLERIEIRGEVFMTYERFEQMNCQTTKCGRNPFSNPRNTAAGSLRQLDSQVTGRRQLLFAPHGLVGCSDGHIFGSQSTFLDNLGPLGFSTYVQQKTVRGIKEAFSACQAMLKARNTYPYGVDGVVIKINNYHLQKLAGCRTKSPRWGVAYKFPSDEKETTVEDVCFQVGRSGVVTPIAKLTEVWIGGVRVQSAILHNIAEMKKKNIRIDSRVTVKRAGDVLPYIIGVQKNKTHADTVAVDIPHLCPSCSAPLVFDEGNIRLRCQMRMSCKAQMEGCLVHFASRDAMGIHGLGLSTAKRLLSNLEVLRDVGDLYSISKEYLLGLGRFGEISAKNLLSQIEQSKQAGLGRLLYALGINSVGFVLAKTIADECCSMDNLLKTSVESLVKIDNIGPTVAHNICEFLHTDENLCILEKFRSAGVSFVKVGRSKVEMSEEPAPPHLRVGKVFVLSGTLSQPRREIKAQLEKKGAKVVSSVSSNATLVCGENPGSKLAKARNCGAAIIDEEGLRAMLRDN